MMVLSNIRVKPLNSYEAIVKLSKYEIPDQNDELQLGFKRILLWICCTFDTTQPLDKELIFWMGYQVLLLCNPTLREDYCYTNEV